MQAPKTIAPSPTPGSNGHSPASAAERRMPAAEDEATIAQQRAAISALRARGMRIPEIAALGGFLRTDLTHWRRGTMLAPPEALLRLTELNGQPFTPTETPAQKGRRQRQEIAVSVIRHLHSMGHDYTTICGWAGISRETLYNWFEGKTSPTPENYEALLRNSRVDLAKVQIVPFGNTDEAARASQREMIDFLIERGYPVSKIADLILSSARTVKKLYEGTMLAPERLLAAVHHVRNRDARALTGKPRRHRSTGNLGRQEREHRRALLERHGLLDPVARVARIKRLLDAGTQVQDLALLIGLNRAYFYAVRNPEKEVLLPPAVVENFLDLEARLLVEDCGRCRTARLDVGSIASGN
jgi:transcriptional regulator with XRE-family HTH domain